MTNVFRKAGNLVVTIGLGVALSMLGVTKAHAIPSFARQTGFSCDVCHTVFPHLTPFGKDFKLHGYTMDTSKTVHADDSDKTMPGLSINKIPMLSVRIVSRWNNQAGGQQQVPGGAVTAGQGFMSHPGGYGNADVLNLVGDSSIYIAGKIAPHLGTFLELTGIDDEGGTLGLGIFDLALVGNDTTLGSKRLVYGVRAVDAADMGDPSNTFGMWGITSTLMAMSTHNTLFDPNQAVVEGGELYGMWGDFETGGLYGSLGVYNPSQNQTGNGFVQGNIATNGSFEGSTGENGAVRLAYYIPSFSNVHTEVGAYTYFGPESMLAPTASTVGIYKDNFLSYGVDVQAQWITDNNLAELFAVYENENDSKFYGTDAYSGTSYATNGTSVSRTGLGIIADYYFRRTYGAYVKYFYRDSAKVQDVNMSGVSFGLSWYAFENANLRLEETMFSKYNAGAIQYGNNSLSPSDFDVTAVKFEYAF